MTACLFGTYDRSHSANRLLHQALAGAGFHVDECHEPLWEETRDKGAEYFAPVSLARLGMRYLTAAQRLVRRWRARSGPPPLVVVGFGGQLDVLLARLVCRPRAALVFAPLVSLSETLVEDRRMYPAGGARARALLALDRATLRLSDLVLADTGAHAQYLESLGVPSERLAVWHHGVEPDFLAPDAPRPQPRRVLYYGRYVPLHGVETIVEAAAHLAARAQVVMVGNGPERPRAEARAHATGAPIVWRDELPHDKLLTELAAAAVVLGVFGSGRKAAMVVPNKVYQAAAAGRPLVTRDGPGLREVLEPGLHCATCPAGDSVALADTIGRLLDDRPRAEQMGRAARAHMMEQFTPDRQAARLARLLATHLGLEAAPVRLVRAAGG